MAKFLLDKGLTILKLRKQFEGTRLADYLRHLDEDTSESSPAEVRLASLQLELIDLSLYEDSKNFMTEEIIPNLMSDKKKFLRMDAGEYVYMYYDYFVLGYGDFMKRALTDDEMFGVMLWVNYSMVVMMYRDVEFRKAVKKATKRYIIF